MLHGWVLWVDPWNSVTGLLPVARARASRCLCLSAHERWDEQVDCHGLRAGDRCQQGRETIILCVWVPAEGGVLCCCGHRWRAVVLCQMSTWATSQRPLVGDCATMRLHAGGRCVRKQRTTPTYLTTDTATLLLLLAAALQTDGLQFRMQLCGRAYCDWTLARCCLQ